MIKIAINGFGRIGRTFLRVLLCDPIALQKINIVAINIGPAKKEYVAHMFKYDTIMGTYPGSVSLEKDRLVIDNHSILIISEPDPAKANWSAHAIDWVVECSGHFTHREGAAKHITAGARNVLISAPAKNEDITIIPGVNDAQFDKTKHHIVSLGSCTTNAFISILKVLHDEFTIERGFMTTIHAYTNSQVLIDVEGEDLRRSRAAALNIIPTSTGVSHLISKIFPDLTDCIEAIALRVPVATGSLIDFSFVSKKSVTIDLINQTFNRASREDSGLTKGIFPPVRPEIIEGWQREGAGSKGHVGITFEPLVSSDFTGDPRSVIIDGLLTATTGNNMGKVFGWYDNEWGYSCRLKDFLVAAK